MATPVGLAAKQARHLLASLPSKWSNGDAKQALEHARKALAQAPDALNRQSLEAMVTALEAGRPIAQ
jgi:hypothetical protein